jgi:hypothetical protein
MVTELDSDMLRRRLDSGWRLFGLGASGPVERFREKLALFGQFVGDWEIFPGEAASKPELRSGADGEVHWRWVMGGLAVQDVWGHRDSQSRRFVPEGTTLRFYDPELEAWRSTWLSPYQRVVRRFIGRPRGDEIVLREIDRGWRGELWIFSDIRRSTFRWRAETRSSPRTARKVTQEYWIRRVRGP